ncbi:hypothetical protein CRG98_029938 [Punica granatum]|uniref:Uncharacterized protein n=1 Tax=Punica granatum TaxID=22663 RepID=A0A2I0J0Z3_PUNGR|nr:hypothetical protein CRG98_029938 [Punica granatum]
MGSNALTIDHEVQRLHTPSAYLNFIYDFPKPHGSARTYALEVRCTCILRPGQLIGPRLSGRKQVVATSSHACSSRVSTGRWILPSRAIAHACGARQDANSGPHSLATPLGTLRSYHAFPHDRRVVSNFAGMRRSHAKSGAQVTPLRELISGLLPYTSMGRSSTRGTPYEAEDEGSIANNVALTQQSPSKVNDASGQIRHSPQQRPTNGHQVMMSHQGLRRSSTLTMRVSRRYLLQERQDAVGYGGHARHPPPMTVAYTGASPSITIARVTVVIQSLGHNFVFFSL